MSLSAAELKRHLEYDPLSGVIRWVGSRRGGVKAGDIAGCSDRGRYIQIRILGHKYLAHRVAWALAHGVWPLNEIDHINHDGLDNRLANLRDVTRAGNSQNMRGPRVDNKLGILGVIKHKGRFLATITTNKTKAIVGRFDTAQEASEAYLEAKRQQHIWRII